jgi:hypothetical protein
MRRAGLFFCVLAVAIVVPWRVFAAGGATGPRIQAVRGPIGAAEEPVFTLAPGHSPASSAGGPALAGALIADPGALAVAPEIVPEVDLPALDLKTAAPVVSVSVFLGRAEDDLFASLHKDYAWRMTFKQMTLGLGISREILLARGIGIQPYLGVIRSSAMLRPSDLTGGRGGSFEYHLTVLSVGLPLFLRFN